MSELSKIRERIDHMTHPTLPSLQKIQQDMKPHVADVSEILRRYSDLLDKYYEQNKPFGSKDATQDLKAFIEIIGFSTIVGSYFLLERWCVQRLQSNSGLLAKPLNYYVEKLEKLHANPSQFELQAEAQPYVEYLIKRLKS